VNNIIDPLVLDLVEWVAKEPRRYAEMLDAWRTSCPRLTVWEEACDRGLVKRISVDGGTIVTVTEPGRRLLRQHRRGLN
jgi:CTP-dependent riboflavin kinase